MGVLPLAWNGSGTFSRVDGSTGWVDDRNAGTKIRADLHDTNDNDLATGINTCIAKDGQSTTTAAIPFAAGINMSDGTVGTPAVKFISDTNSGWYRIGADNVGLSLGGAKVVDYATTGVAITGTLRSTSDFAVNTNKFTVAGASGNTVIAGTLTVTGGQVSFPAAQSASADANTLDDYEEGTFTPTMAFGGGSVGLTYTTQNGRYTKIGRIVFFDARIVVNAVGSSTGAVTVGSLPFTAAATYYSPCSCYITSLVGPFSTVDFAPSVTPGSTNIAVDYIASGSASSLTHAAIQTGTDVRLSGHFTV